MLKWIIYIVLAGSSIALKAQNNSDSLKAVIVNDEAKTFYNNEKKVLKRFFDTDNLRDMLFLADDEEVVQWDAIFSFADEKKEPVSIRVSTSDFPDDVLTLKEQMGPGDRMYFDKIKISHNGKVYKFVPLVVYLKLKE